jgi:uncharacterized protein (DUF1697 family)
MAMQHSYVALLRAIRNVPMQPFREAMAELGFSDVESFGMSGNLLFNAGGGAATAFERRIAARLKAPAFVRTRRAMGSIVRNDPFRDEPGDPSVLFLAAAPAAARRRAFMDLEFETPRPVLRGQTVYFLHPARVAGKRAPFNFENALGVEGTARSSRVVERLWERMSKG